MTPETPMPNGEAERVVKALIEIWLARRSDPPEGYSRTTPSAAIAALRPSTPADDVVRLREALERLAQAEGDYRYAHDHFGPDDIRCGRAWDEMRWAGNAARAALESDGWLPIESAPKDGRYIDVARHMGDFGWVLGVAYWVKDLGGGWIAKGTGVFGELGLGHPTHFRHRPAPPAAHVETGERP